MEKEKFLNNEKETNLNQENIENENSVEKLAEQVETIIKNNSPQDEEYDEEYDEEEISVHDIEENEYLADDYDIDDEITEDDEFSIKDNEYLADDYDINDEVVEDNEETQEDSQIENNEYLADDYDIDDEITKNDEDDFLNEDDKYLLNKYTDSDDNFDGDTFESLIQEVQQTLDNISVTGKKHKHSMYTLPVKEEFFEELIEKEEINPVKEVPEEVKNYTEDIEEPLGGVYSADEEKPLTGSFTLKDQPENNDTVEIIEEEQDVDVPIGGSFDVEPADVTVSGTFTQKRKKKEVIYPQSPIFTVDEPDEEFVSNPELYADNSENNVTDSDDEVTFVAVDNGIELEDDYVEENNFIDVLELDDDDTEEVILDKAVEFTEELASEKTDEFIEEAVLDKSVKKEKQAEAVKQTSNYVTKKDVENFDSVVEKQTNETLTGIYKEEDLKETVKEAEMVSDVETLSEEVNIEEIKATDVPEEEIEVVSAVEETTEPVSEEEIKIPATEKAETVAENNTVISEESNEEIDIEKEYNLDEEKPLTGSFKLKEQLEILIEKNVETLDVPLSGSFGVEPAEVTVSGSYNSNDEKPATVESKSAEEVVATVAPVSEVLSKEVENAPAVEEVPEETTEPVSEEEIKTPATEKAETVAENNTVISAENNEEIDIEKEYSLDDEKPLTGSFKLKEQLEVLIEKNVETLDVPLSGSFGVEPAEVTVSGSYNSN
ncbi:MAG: hypothetical protein UH239_09145, partial [Acutalibacteraceae bacterium]|nr:hypothetical protein [Acutalibacteraceae bacterium]